MVTKEQINEILYVIDALYALEEPCLKYDLNDNEWLSIREDNGLQIILMNGCSRTPYSFRIDRESKGWEKFLEPNINMLLESFQSEFEIER